MADESEIRRINWGEVFSFTHIFKSFRLAMHLGKIALAVALITLIFSFGWAMDCVWGWFHVTAAPSEIIQHCAMPGDAFARWKDAQEDGRLDAAIKLLAEARQEYFTLNSYLGTRSGGTAVKDIPDMGKVVVANLDEHNKNQDKDFKVNTEDEIRKDVTTNKLSYSNVLSKAEDQMKLTIEKIEKVTDAYKKAKESIEKDAKPEDKAAKLRDLDRNRTLPEMAITIWKAKFNQGAKAIRGEAISAALVRYEVGCISNAISAIRHGNLFGGMADYQDLTKRRSATGVDDLVRADAGAAAAADLLAQAAPRPADERPGFAFWVLMGIGGIGWLLCTHWLYAIIFLAFSLVVWAVLGGAIYRIAALQAARDEKISISQAVKFSIGKFASFVSAPILPLVIILILGVLLTAGGALLGTWGGGILLGILLVVALVFGLAIAFLLVGWGAGGPLMYPTIAVEGSDSFDAISRSFSYVLSRPWRASLYAVVALVYGTITYLFVRLFVFLALASTHFFLKWGVFSGGQRLGPGADMLDVLWAAPTFDNLWGSYNWDAMTYAEPAGAWIIGVWVFLLAAVVGAYLVTFFASSSTIIYLLLRRKVDATDLDDVYVEEAEEQTSAPAAAPVAPAGPSQGAPAAGIEFPAGESQTPPTTPPKTDGAAPQA